MSQIIARVFLEKETLAQVAVGLGLFLGVLLARALLVWGMEVTASAAAVRLKARLRQELFEKLLALGPAYTRGERTGELTNVAVEGIEALHSYFSQYLPQLVLAALVPLTFLAFILPLDRLSAAVLLLTAPLMPLFMILIGSMAEAITKKQWKTMSRLSAYFLDVLQGLTTLKVFGRAQSQVRVIARLSERYRQTTMEVLRVAFLSALALELLSALSTAIVAVEIGLRLLSGKLLFEQAFFVLFLAPEFYLPLRMLGARFHAGMAGAAAAERIYEILSLPDQLAGPASQEELPYVEPGQNFSLTFDEVCFSYEGDHQALVNISFGIQSGRRVALVGPSGAGKTTLAFLLLRFLQPSRGRIQWDGLNIARISPQSWRQMVAWVPQSPYLFHDTVFANIRMARPQANRDQVVQASILAHAHEFIEKLPAGYETLIGEKGARLSRGQAQRIALARAFLKDAPVLILDEATSSLDPEHEALVADSLEKLMPGRLTLVIAHRLATVYRADQILVMDQGRLVERGTHAELMERGGLYRRLVQNWGVCGREAPASTPISHIYLPSPGDEVGRGDGEKETISPNIMFGKCHAFGFYSEPFLRLTRMISPLAPWIALAVLLGAATVGSSIGLMASSAYIISAAALRPSIADLQLAIVGVRFFGLARGVFRYLERYTSHQVTFRILAQLRTGFYQALEPLAPARLLGYWGGDLLGRAIGDIAELENFYVRALAPPLVAGVVAAATSLYLSAFSPVLAVTLLAFFLAGGLGVTWLVRGLGGRVGTDLVEVRSALNARLVESIQGMADLLAFGFDRSKSEEVFDLSRRYGTAQMGMARLTGFQSALSLLLANLAMWAVLIQAIPLVADGRLPGVYLTVLTLVVLASFEAVVPLPLAAQHMEGNLAAARRLFQIVDEQPAVQDPLQPCPPPESVLLEVKGLRFQYPADIPHSIEAKPNARSAMAVLDGLSFCLPQGGKLAIVGPSGAGKTTLVHLLLRFWDYQEGSILLGCRDLRDYRQEDVRRLISLVSQDTYLFNATVRENLLIARMGASESEIFQAARLAQIHDFFQSLPEGYETWIGEQGIRLSAGERQRLAIARALLKDAPLLILDEPTANLDTLTERNLLEALYRLMGGRTTLLITHRLVGLEAVDEILVIDKGRVVERGHHRELLEARGLYRRLWDLQNQVQGIG